MREARMAVVLGAALLLASSGRATTVKDANIRQLADLSERIFIGEVVGQRARLVLHDDGVRKGRSVVTDTTFRVDEVLKGQKQTGPFMLTQRGGEIPGVLAQAVAGQARFTVGERVLVLVERASAGNLVVAGMSLGKYRLETAANTGEITAVRDPSGLLRLGRAAPPKLRFAGLPESEDRLPLTQLVALIRGELHPMPVPKKLRPWSREGQR